MQGSAAANKMEGLRCDPGLQARLPVGVTNDKGCLVKSTKMGAGGVLGLRIPTITRRRPLLSRH